MMQHPSHVIELLVSINVAGKQVLYICLGADGSISRMGDGSEGNRRTTLCAGKCSSSLFQQLNPHIDQLYEWIGVYTAPCLEGKLCELTIGMRRDDGAELFSDWKYGTRSQGPPPAIRDCVVMMLNLTDSWYERQSVLADETK